MTDAGRHAIAAAQSNGWWTISDPVENLEEPLELKTALDRDPDARNNWDDFPPSARKQMLWWIVSAVRDDTRAGRIDRIVADAAIGRRARG
ncbi:YdeI/OmpD-associated family protein [Rhodococcoides fascians]|uniref:YdeI/OmpD-associated family protein n=1 Tax=Rhodococcoides fascians TaxID=1828 RepID=UPI000ABB5EB9|nr:YdeI/OmpD-associated family protein [Rhodococcus fascians]